MSKVMICRNCEQKRYVNYTGLCKRCNKEMAAKMWAKNQIKGEK